MDALETSSIAKRAGIIILDFWELWNVAIPTRGHTGGKVAARDTFFLDHQGACMCSGIDLEVNDYGAHQLLWNLDSHEHWSNYHNALAVKGHPASSLLQAQAP